MPIAAKPLADLKVELIDLVDDFGGPHAEKSKILHGIAWEGAGVKRRAITRRHGFERVLARGATIAAHLIGAAADREPRLIVPWRQPNRKSNAHPMNLFIFLSSKNSSSTPSWRNIL